MAKPPTEAQLRNGAQGIAYRAGQLVACTKYLTTHEFPVVVSPPDAIVTFQPEPLATINNALIECALVQSRALAYFFFSSSDVNVRMWHADWRDDVIDVAREVESPISRHHSHATTGDKDGELHPGAWPIPELAVTLVGGFARFVEGLDPTSPEYMIEWFTPAASGYQPSPAELLAMLMAIDPLAEPTEISGNPRVAALTRALRKHLALA
jgi:hypothetical protein